MYRRKPGGVWYISVGGVRQSSETKDRDRAKRLEHKLNTEAWDRSHGLVAPTWDQACLSWIREYPRESGLYLNIKYASWWEPHLTGKKLTAIRRELVHGIVSEKFGAEDRRVDLKTRVPQNGTANGYVGFVARIIRHGSNLAPKFIRYPAVRFRERWLTVAEWQDITCRMAPDTRDILTYALATGQRAANVKYLEWGWINGDAVFTPATETKTDVPYGIPLNKTALAVLERRRQAPVKHLKYVFTDRGKPWYEAALLRHLSRVCSQASIPPITVHGLRHTFTTWLARAGVPKEVRKRLLGHSGGDVHDGYTHFDIESLRPHVEVIDRVMGEHSRLMPSIISLQSTG